MSINNNYTAEVGIKFNDARLQSQLKSLASKTIEVNAKLSGGTSTQINSINKALLKMKETTVGTVSEINNLDSKTTASLRNVNKSINTTSQTLQTASKHTKTLGQDFIDTAGKVAKFGAITAIFGLVTGAISEAVNVVKEFDSAMTEFNKVSDISGSNLDSYTEKLGELGTEIARTRTQMVEASTEFVKSGYTEEQSAQLAKVAGLYQNVADSELTAGESSAYLISQMKAFNISATDAIGIIDKTNEVANRFAVSSTDISTALTKSSSALATYGNTMSESISLVTAGTELMTGQASKVSKGIRSIGANIIKLANDTGVLEYSVNGATKSLSLFDEQGEMLSTFDVLKEVAKDWDNMTTAEQSSLALAQAG